MDARPCLASESSSIFRLWIDLQVGVGVLAGRIPDGGAGVKGCVKISVGNPSALVKATALLSQSILIP